MIRNSLTASAPDQSHNRVEAQPLKYVRSFNRRPLVRLLRTILGLREANGFHRRIEISFRKTSVFVLVLVAAFALVEPVWAQSPEEAKKKTGVDLKLLLEKLLSSKKPGQGQASGGGLEALIEKLLSEKKSSLKPKETQSLKEYYEKITGTKEKAPATEYLPPPAPAGPEPYLSIEVDKHRLISLNFLNTDIRKAISALAMKTGINVVTGMDVSGNVSVNLHRASLDQTLEALTLAGGLAYQKRGAVYFIYTPKEARELKPERLEMKFIKLKYAQVEKVQEIMDALPGLRLVKVHEPSKTIIVEDTPENIKKIELILSYWDAKPRQAMIEARILEISLTDDMALGVNWATVLGDYSLGTGGFSSAVMSGAPGASPVPVAGKGIFVNLISGTGTDHPLRAALSALESKTSVETLSTPKILAIHGKSAKVQVGGKQGYKISVTSDGVVSENIKFIDTGTILEITPYIDSDGNVLLNVTASINSARIEEGTPVVNTTVVTTWLLARHGETALIGGLIQNTKQKRREMIPCLGNIPILGFVFGRTAKGTGKSELVILITPTVLDMAPEQTELDVRENLEKTKKVEETFEK